jgi:hypothetical protein
MPASLTYPRAFRRPGNVRAASQKPYTHLPENFPLWATGETAFSQEIQLRFPGIFSHCKRGGHDISPPLGDAMLAEISAFCRVSCLTTVITAIGTVGSPAR